MDLRKTALRFRHLGIPKTEKGYFKACVDACVQDNFMRGNAIYLWGSIFFAEAPPERTNAIIALLANIWGLAENTIRGIYTPHMTSYIEQSESEPASPPSPRLAFFQIGDIEFNLFENRRDIILGHPEWDSTYWNAHEALGVDETSSYESESESINNRVYRIRKPWRSRAIDRMIHFIDAGRDQAAERTRRFTRSGRVFRVRIGYHPTKQSTIIPPNPPSNFYDREWLAINPLVVNSLPCAPPMVIL
ncbi:hypothetical protein M422DRAFT_266556 [Sphaerobolus stellatus SS14]|uniref:Uncharacterized protein n=1 Tax=Sphaerobolus stellatus (strain SS14) TaxID=990650 RepID=A0A0C9V2P4_SPHS4|nr:hypothetical protein M422DRAFT_266556 [Sphaerobolus stellatus SS14]